MDISTSMPIKRTALTLSTLIVSMLTLQAEESHRSMALDDIPYGIEAVAQYRSEYNYRGFILAQDSIDLQLGAQYAFDNTTYIDAALWFGSEIGKGDFTGTGTMAELSKELGDFTLSLGATYRSYSSSFFEDGVSAELGASYQLSQNCNLSALATYDTGAEGWYSNIQLAYYHRINDDSYLNLSGGLSAVDDFYQRRGLNDSFAKCSYTYNINQSVSVSPYIGTSILLDSDDTGSDSLHGGVYFAVSF